MTKVTRSEVDPTIFGADVALGHYNIYASDVCSTGLTTCIGFVAVGRDVAVVGHFSSIDVPDSGDRKLFDEAVQSARLINAGRYWLLGGGPLIREGVDIVEPDRKYAEGLVRNSLSSGASLETIWTPPDMAIDFAVRPLEENSVVIHIYPKL